MRRHHAFAAVSLVFYALILAGTWIYGCRWEMRKTVALLRWAQSDFSERLENVVNAVQWCQASLAFDAIGGRVNVAPKSVAAMREIAERLYIDEFNLVSSNGVVIASNIPKVLGDDWHANPNTAAYLTLLSPTSRYWRLSQPFRHGTVNPEYFCTYHGQVFDDRSGIIQVGYSMDRLAEVIGHSDGTIFERWRVGRCGHYAIVDEDGDTRPDKAPAGYLPELRHIHDGGESAYVRRFAYAGRLFQAIVPTREFGGQRLLGFLVLAITSGVLISVFALILFKLLRSNRRVDSLRRAADARQAADLAVARTIQLSSLPNVKHYRKVLFTVSLAAVMRPAREVGGDFYDSYFTDSTHLAFVVADVAGKGFAAAMFMMRAKNELFNALCAEHELDQAVAMANARICEHNEAEMLVTAWVGVLDINSGEVEYVNAGHNRPFVRRAGGTVEKVMGRGGLLFGVKADAAYQIEHLALKPGDLLFVFTDGITEAMNRDHAVYGEHRLTEVLKGCGADPEAAVAAVNGAIGEFVGEAEQSDDVTSFALVWHGAPELRQQKFPAVTGSLASAVQWLDREIALKSRKSKMRLLNAADEIIANIVSYSGTAELSLTVENAPGRTRVTFADSGREYNPLSHVDPDTHAALEERPEGGLGILMTKRLVDAVHYHRGDGLNVLKLVKLDD